ncbi:MAG: biotin--[acetyl-CoA-carboxylase] ligase, partial [Vicinamibacterales bacterium]
FVGRRKLAGILAEGVLPEGGVSRGARVQDPLHVVLGYGINVEPAAYPRELSDRVTSVSSELGRPVDRADVFVETLAALGRRYDDLLAGRFDTILDGWRARARGAEGAAVEWETPGGTHGGVTCGVDGDGALLVRTARQLERVVSGELRWECF